MQLLIVLAGLVSHVGWVRAESLHSVSMLNQFGAEPTPGVNEPIFKELTEFMEKSRPGGTLKLAYSESFVSIFPTAIRNGDFRARAPLAADFLYETLMTLDPRRDDYSIYPLMVRELKASDDFCHLRVELRPDVRFSDGTPLRTKDVHFSLDTYVNDFFSGAMAELIHRTSGKMVMTDRSDLEFDLEFTELPKTGCRQAAYYFLNGIPLLKRNTQAPPSKEVEMPYLGSGPYLVDQASRSLLRFRRNPEYWARDHEHRRHTFNPAAVEVRVFMDPILERFALLRGEVNLMRDTQFTYDEWMKAQTARRPIVRLDQNSDGLGTEIGAVWMNQRHAHTGNVDFRRALLLVWDVVRANRDFYADRRHALAAPGIAGALYPRGMPSPGALEILGRAKEDPNYPRALGPADRLEYERLNRPTGLRARLRLARGWLEHGGYAYGRVDGHTLLVKDGKPVEITAIVRLGSPELKLFLRFKNELRLLGITLNLREFGDRTALVSALQANQYDLFPSAVSIAREFSIINASYLMMELHSSLAEGLGAWGRVHSKLIDVTLDELDRTKPSDPGYPAAIESFLRAFNANVPILPSGELDPVVTYHHESMRVWKNRDRDLWTLYFEN